MTKNNYDYEAAKLLIDDETNVTETNPLKDLFQTCIQLVLILALVYLHSLLPELSSNHYLLKNKFRWKIYCPL